MKNKKIISGLLAVAMIVSVFPIGVLAKELPSGEKSISKIEQNNSTNATDESIANVNNADDLKNAIQNEKVKTINLLTEEITIDSTLEINRGLTINGNGNSIIYPKKGDTKLFYVKTNDSVEINNLNADSDSYIMSLQSKSPHIYVYNSEFYTLDRGISFESQDTVRENAEIILDNSKIRCKKIGKDVDFDKNTYIGDTRGIAIHNARNSTVTVRNKSEISGFGYTINATGMRDSKGIVDASGLTVNVKDSILRGWTGFNIWTSFAKYNIDNSYILGINNSNGNSDSFSAITFNRDLYNMFDGLHSYSNELYIKDTTITNYQNEGLSTKEELLRLDNGLSKLTFAGNINFIDTTGKIKTALYLKGMDGNEEEKINFLKNNVSYEDGAKVSMRLARETTVEVIGKDGGNKFFVDIFDAVAGAKKDDTVKLLEDIVLK